MGGLTCRLGRLQKEKAHESVYNGHTTVQTRARNGLLAGYRHPHTHTNGILPPQQSCTICTPLRLSLPVLLRPALRLEVSARSVESAGISLAPQPKESIENVNSARQLSASCAYLPMAASRFIAPTGRVPRPTKATQSSL